MLKKAFVWLTVCALGAMSCQSKPTDKTAAAADKNAEVPAATPGGKIDNAAIMARKQVPVVCYHQIRDWKATDSKNSKDYIIQIAAFKEHIKLLADSGYHTILPDQLYAYLTTGAPLPKKPIMLTFDDTDLDQFTIANPTLKKYGFKAVYFVMTVSIGRPHYMTADMVKKLSDEGNVIGSHTWDHHRVDKYSHNSELKIIGKNGKITTRPVDDWVTQIDKPTKKLEEITGKKIDYFAYPFGVWKKPVLPEFQKRGFKIAFQLADKRDPDYPLMTVRRILDSGYWSTKTFGNSVRNSF
ncbi:polysaccharide deacetylase family protein [Mucilaginibacter lappiensis]|uniref:Peptidoglycan/xylan/chitin deacetylase (PgdA/CDA1 family) n=1 Tax=Mucilaginibacter lappiensis TaxID=354630 RepID=A0A841JJG4_9SPHI|nr:polysaccharide deacetylase family protein [Mucilaginibacter lappiensis]MBB6128838.1 peptidoglycan/xylan/chitin deacetylase (PgdA/CDA1 family) [Mucilaginibacter lappiensis]